MKTSDWWGQSCSIDLHGCDNKLLKSPRAIKRFVSELCKLLNMKKSGATLVKRFGSGRLEGYSMMQFIETSSIVAHFDEFGNRAFLDVFSCKKYDAKVAAAFCKKFFKAKQSKVKNLHRK